MKVSSVSDSVDADAALEIMALSKVFWDDTALRTEAEEALFTANYGTC